MSEQALSAKEETAFFSGVAQAGRTLLGVLGVPWPDPLLLTLIPSEDVSHAPGLLRLENTPSPTKEALATRVASRLNATANFRGTTLLAIAPYAVAALVAAAEDGHRKEQHGSKGAPPQRCAKALFNGLASFHLDMFGRWPEIDSPGHRGGRDGRSVEWAYEILLLAVERIPPVLMPIFGTDEAKEAVSLETAALNKLAGLKTGTIGKRLAEATTFARQRRA